VGEGTSIGRVHVQLHAPVTIGDYVVINDGVRVLTGTHDVDDAAWALLARPVTIGDHAWIGTGAILLPGVEVGRGGVVGAGAVVTRNVEPFEVVGGNPARHIRQRRCTTFSARPTRLLGVVEAWLGRPEP
ncbi:MAG TPA: DapH/DapD/GlmU-related protein, partial [Longimicrobiaceae bacterium]